VAIEEEGIRSTIDDEGNDIVTIVVGATFGRERSSDIGAGRDIRR